MPPTRPVTITVVPTSAQRREFRRWAGARGVATLPGNGFAVPQELLGELPHELILGARVNGEVYMPAPGQPRHDAPPLETEQATAGEWIPLEGELIVSPDVVAGYPQPGADDIPTTGAPDVDGDDSP